MNKRLIDAKKNKNDEFYTMYGDIEKELIHYKEYFEDKIVYCNCDGEDSNFVKYFKDNYDSLKLKGLLYSSLKDSIDFRSEESIDMLKQADIVVTNPPFSLFREYVAQLMEYDKKFLIIGNQNAITYKEIFPLIKDNRILLGITMNGSNIWFTIPDDYPFRENAAGTKIVDGKKMVSVNGVRWFTNLTHRKRNQLLPLYAKQSEKHFPKYDNYDAINIDKIADIPYDYDGIMGVPITFIDKFNPDQFEILGLGNSRFNFMPNKKYIKPIKHLKNGSIGRDAAAVNSVLVLAIENRPLNTTYYTSDNSQYLVAPYARVLLKHKLTYDEHGIVIGVKGETNEI